MWVGDSTDDIRRCSGRLDNWSDIMELVEFTVQCSPGPLPSGYGGPHGTWVLVDVEQDKVDELDQAFRDAI